MNSLIVCGLAISITLIPLAKADDPPAIEMSPEVMVLIVQRNMWLEQRNKDLEESNDELVKRVNALRKKTNCS